jgi:superfamily II DNA or RNA helicase
MRVYISNEICFEDFEPSLLEWCLKNLVIPNPDYVKKQKMGLWLGKTPKFLELYRLERNKLFVPYGCAKALGGFIRCSERVVNLNSGKVFFDNVELPLYDYQRVAVDELLKSGGGILKSKAGSGKTQMAIALMLRIGCQTLWLTHTQDLLKQSYNRAKEFVDESYLGTITEGKVHIGTFTFATVQTMSKLDLSLYKNTFGCVIVDECHRAAGTPTRVTQFSKVINSLAARYKYGLSATVHRSDGLLKSLFALIGGISYVVPDMSTKVMSVEVMPRMLGTEKSFDYCDTDGTIVYAKFINYLAECEDRNCFIASQVDTGKSSLILSDRKKQLETLRELIPGAVVLTGDVSAKKRVEILRKAKSGEIKTVLSTYSLAKEGLDIPCMEQLHFATPVKDYAIVVQSIGRVARACEGKGQPVVFDYVDCNIGLANRLFRERQRHYRKEGVKLCER